MRIGRRPPGPPTRFSWLDTYIGFSGILALVSGATLLIVGATLPGMLALLWGVLGLMIGYRQENSRR